MVEAVDFLGMAVHKLEAVAAEAQRAGIRNAGTWCAYGCPVHRSSKGLVYGHALDNGHEVPAIGCPEPGCDKACEPVPVQFVPQCDPGPGAVVVEMYRPDATEFLGLHPAIKEVVLAGFLVGRRRRPR